MSGWKTGSVVVLCVVVMLAPLAGIVLAGLVVFGGHHMMSQRGGGGASCVVDVGGRTELEAADASGAPVALDAVQLNNAAAVIAAGNEAGVGQSGQVIGLMTALQESSLRNLANPKVPESLGLSDEGLGSDRDSVGVMQQRPSMGWGAVAELMDPVKSSGIFFDRLKGIEGWEQLGPGAAAQKVQASAHPEAYDRWEPVARALVSALASVSCTPAAGAPGGGPAVGVEGTRAAIVNYAMSQVGKPYIWAAEGPDAFDCSGLTMRAYEAGGLPILTHASGEQRHAGVEVSAEEAKPGDLLWWPGHVAIYTGNGRMVGAQSPGEGVREMAVYGAPVYVRPPGLD